MLYCGLRSISFHWNHYAFEVMINTLIGLFQASRFLKIKQKGYCMKILSLTYNNNLVILFISKPDFLSGNTLVVVNSHRVSWL